MVALGAAGFSKLERISTCPVDPLTRIRSPVLMRRVASDVPTTAGIENSRDTTAGWEAIPPASVTRPLMRVKRTTQAGLVMRQTAISPFWTFSNSSGESTNLAVPSTTPLDAGSPLMTSRGLRLLAVEFLRETPVCQIGKGEGFVGSGSHPIAGAELVGVFAPVAAIGNQFGHLPGKAARHYGAQFIVVQIHYVLGVEQHFLRDQLFADCDEDNANARVGALVDVEVMIGRERIHLQT